MANRAFPASAYGFTETHIDALGDVTLLDKSFDGPGADYVFWDPIHPTTKSHRVIADWFLSFVAPLSPQISVAASGTAVELRLERLDPGTTYVLQSSDDLSVWSDMKWFSTASSRYFTTIKPNALPQTFFRVKWLPPDRVEGRPLANGMLARIHRQFGE